MNIGKESFFWHKLHSLSGILPVGYYMVQHLTLNTFSLAGPEKFNGIIKFFEGMPTHFLFALKIFAIWIPLFFHAIYGLFIVRRSEGNYSEKAYRYRENRYYTLQRWSGIAAFIFLVYHMSTTSFASTISKYTGGVGAEGIIYYEQWASKLASFGYLVLVVYMLGVAACAYHFSYGIWNFCIRWGITISERAQMKTAKLSSAAFIGLTLMGWLALFGFFYPVLESKEKTTVEAQVPAITRPASVITP